MRKIQTIEHQEARRQRSVRILSLVLVFLLLGSSIGYGFSLFLDSGGTVSTPTSSEPYFDGQQWVVTRGNAQLYLTYGPTDVVNTSISLRSSLTDFGATTAYISSPDDVVSSELYRVLSPYSQQLQSACYGPCDLELPEKTCSDYLIVWTNSTTNRVWQQDKCTFIEGDLKTVDAYLYYLLGYI